LPRNGYVSFESNVIDPDFIRYLLNLKDIDVNIKNASQNTPLHYLCQSWSNPSDLNIFDIFFKKGADVNAVNDGSETPLMKVCFFFFNFFLPVS